MKIPISKPLMGEEEKAAVVQPLETGWVVQGPKVAEFEQLFCKFTGARHAVATTSCTTALHLAMIMAGVGPGDEVIVPAYTWVATANVVEMQGAKPVFVDIELDTFNIDVTQIERAITKKTKAIMPVSLFGISADLDPILKLGLPVVEDAACAMGTFYHGKHAGTLTQTGCFSFHPRKAITTGEGGMLTTNDPELDALARSLRDHGASKSDLARHMGPRAYLLPDFNVMGFNYRMTDLQGALGVVQMGRAEWIFEQRRRLAKVYDQALEPLGWLRPPVVPQGYIPGYQAYVCLFQPEKPSLDNVERLHAERNALMDRLEGLGIATRPGTHCVHNQGFYAGKYGYRSEDFPNAFLADQLTLAIPLYAQMTEEEQAYVLQHLGAERKRETGVGSRA